MKKACTHNSKQTNKSTTPRSILLNTFTFVFLTTFFSLLIILGFRLGFRNRHACSQEFLLGGGGGAYFKNRNQIINVGTLSHARAEALRREDRGHAPPEQF